MRVSEGEVGGVETRRGEGNRGSLGPKAAGCTLVAGAYVTDGCSLFRIEHTHADRGSGKMFVELENCISLELSMWPADTLAERPLRYVVPVWASEPHNAACA